MFHYSQNSCSFVAILIKKDGGIGPDEVLATLANLVLIPSLAGVPQAKMSKEQKLLLSFLSYKYDFFRKRKKEK